MLLDDEDDVDDSRKFVVQLLLFAMLVVMRVSLCSMMSGSWRCQLDPVMSDADLDVFGSCRGGTCGSPSDPDVLALVVGQM